MPSNYTDLNKIKTSTENKLNNQVKTTDVNILLNRVRLDRKKTLLKKILFTFLLASTVSLIGTFFIL